MTCDLTIHWMDFDLISPVVQQQYRTQHSLIPLSWGVCLHWMLIDGGREYCHAVLASMPEIKLAWATHTRAQSMEVGWCLHMPLWRSGVARA